MIDAPQTLLILDTETTGLSPADSQCVEVGAILFSVPHRAVLTQVSFLVPCLVNGAEFVNKIPAAITQLEQPTQAGLDCFDSMLACSDAVVAHNAAFDKQWFGVDPLPEVKIPWICSMDDISWPAELRLKSRPSVTALALAYGVPVWAAHRALTDCSYLAHVFERCDDLEKLLKAAQESRELYAAILPYDRKEEAKEAGFRWVAEARQWQRKLSQTEVAALNFSVKPAQ